VTHSAKKNKNYPRDPFLIKKIFSAGESRHLKLNVSNRTANIKGKKTVRATQTTCKGDRVYSSKTANVTGRTPPRTSLKHAFTSKVSQIGG